jgi:hypothetical protein
MADTVEWTTEGLNFLRNWLAGDAPTAPARIATGTGTTGTVLGTTGMETQVDSQNIESFDKEGDAQITFVRTLGTSATENGSAITEIGIDNGSDDALFLRQTGTAINKTDSTILRIECQVTLANAP